MKMNKSAWCAALLSTTILVGSMGSSAADEEITIRSIPIGNLTVLDPIWTTAYITRNHAYMVWDTLFAMDENNEVQPQMVDTYEISDDGLTYTFTLREGLLWHDGEPVTAADCVASIERWAAVDGMGQAMMRYTDSIDAVDDDTFTIQLSEPIGFVLEALGKIDSVVPFMMPERLALTPPDEQIEEVIGSGPFRFVEDEWVPGSVVVYERFDDYVPRDEPPSMAAGGKVVHIDRVESVYMPDAGVAMSAIGAGEVDIYESPPTDLLGMLEGNPDVTLQPNDPVGWQIFMVLNNLHPPFDDREAREAMLWATNQEDYMANVAGDPDRYEVCPAFFGCGGPNESDAGSEAILAVDVDRARAMIEEAGVMGADVVLLDPADNSTLHPAALMGTQSLRELGFNVIVEAVDWSTLTQRRASRNAPSDGGWNVFITSATATGMNNPLTNNYAKHCDDAWYGWPCDERIPELTDAWALETDEEARAEIVDELQRIHMEHVTYVPLGQFRRDVVYSNQISGVLPGPAIFYWNIRKED
ncbi:ABC transporter substrate-binding protein [Fodinicurvata sp. EGI_FJ10296]|uniref:ABC transporter substrate-binding protein n=1 Tax=Fodinicurvata sp. EGI_FJ10296 TaxID=3231908 RepID=UPI0034536F89